MPKIKITPEIGQKFKSIRLENNIKSTDLVKMFGKSPAYYTKFEKGLAADIEFKDFLSMIEMIVNNDTKKFNNALKIILNDVSAEYSDEEKNKAQSYENFDIIARRITIPDEYLKSINAILIEKDINLVDLVKLINSNAFLKMPQEEIDKLPKNYWIKTDKLNEFCIKLDYKYEEIENIIMGKEKYSNYTTLQIIAFYIFILIGEKYEVALTETMNVLKKCKIYTLREKNEIIKNSKNLNEIEEMLSVIDITNQKLFSSIMSKLSFVSTINVDYSNGKFKVFDNNLKVDNMLTLAYLGVDLSTLKELKLKNKKKFIADITALVEKYQNMTFVDDEPELI